MMNNWISVEDRLPRSSNDVIVFTKTDEIEIGNYSHCDAHWLTSSYGEVLYWMPLPAKPEKKYRTKQNTCAWI